MPASKNNESKLKAAGLRMALKLLPPDLLNAAPQHLENFLTERLKEVDPQRHEAGACYLIAPDNKTGQLRILTVTLDEQNAVSRIVNETNFNELFQAILKNFQDL